MSCGPPGGICRADDVAVGFGRAGGYLEMNVYQPLLIYNIAHSITGDRQLHELLPVPGGRYAAQPEENQRVRRQLADAGDGTVSVIGYDKASKIAHYANDHDLTLKAAALKLGLVPDAEFDRIVDPSKTVRPYDAGAA
jgi:fumarate hydratase class II